MTAALGETVTVPSAPNGTITWFDNVWPARVTLRFDDAPSAVAPFVGTTCQKPASVASVTVRLNTTADA